jgi:hypothetical protein
MCQSTHPQQPVERDRSVFWLHIKAPKQTVPNPAFVLQFVEMNLSTHVESEN